MLELHVQTYMQLKKTTKQNKIENETNTMYMYNNLQCLQNMMMSKGYVFHILMMK